ncbi:hypothetical protein PoB_005807600 [Plakobranchus ocellatus]|uniref:Uncharacterized protein n=1 Tax=Plakobranchus ocellatus TaxID=259542 RepID=A0AAV4C8D9_9GAST|nr:hypothetical protein PoB_005807600 [Plakobranchus ocellatus]
MKEDIEKEEKKRKKKRVEGENEEETNGENVRKEEEEDDKDHENKDKDGESSLCFPPESEDFFKHQVLWDAGYSLAAALLSVFIPGIRDERFSSFICDRNHLKPTVLSTQSFALSWWH